MRDHVVGLISDTHGLIRPEALRALDGVELIVHAGDVGGSNVLEALGEIAPVVAVRGNMDGGGWALDLPGTEVVEIGAVALYVLHDRGQLDLDPRAAGFAAVVSGHSHRPSIEEDDGVLYLNPGSAGPQRFSNPISLMRLEICGRTLGPELVDLVGGR
jgi:putative phosphoesterase